MHPVAPTAEQVCGRCRKFEPSRADPKYGYCKSSLAHEREISRIGYAKARLVDVEHACLMAVWHGMERRPAFVAKESP